MQSDAIVIQHEGIKQIHDSSFFTLSLLDCKKLILQLFQAIKRRESFSPLLPSLFIYTLTRHSVSVLNSATHCLLTMDVFSLLKFWQNAGVGDPINADFTDDEGSFFELVFTNPTNLQDNDSPSPTVNIISGFHSDHSNLDGADLKSNHTYSSPTLFFNNKRKILPLDHSSSNTNTKTPRSPFRVLMLGFHSNKSKSDKKELKCELEEVTISSLLKRDNSFGNDQTPSKRFSKDVLHRYLNLIKPLYIKRSNDKVRLPQHSKEEKPSVFKEVRKHLGKSQSSSSSAVKPFPSPAVRRDDSALQQQDGIQSAILHCKKSYNSPSQGCNGLSRSGSAPSQGSRISVDEEKRSSI